MSVFSKYGIKSKGKYLFYTVGDDSAVLLAVKRKKKRDLSMIVIPEIIGKYTVRGVASLHSKINAIMRTDIPQKIKTKLNDLQWNYSNLDNFGNYTLPETIEYIGVLPERRFKCSTEKIYFRFELPKNVSYIENSKISTKTLVLPKDVKYIGKVTDPDTLENIFTNNESCDEGVPHYSLAQYRGEKEDDRISHPKIAEKAFYNHSRLNNISLPDGIQEIEEDAFSGIRMVKQFHFPKSLEKISANAFSGTELTGTFRYPSDFPAGLEKDNYNFEITGKIVLEDMVHLEDMMQGKNAKGESFTDFASEIDLSSVSGKLPDRAFYKEGIRSSIKFPTILLGDNITEIGESAFEGNPIKSLRLPSNLRSIGKNAFKDCPNLRKLMLPNSLEIVEEGAFNTKCELSLAAKPGTFTRISGQKGYLEYLQIIEAPRRKAAEFIEKYKDYFAGKKTKTVPPIRDLIDMWSNYGRNPKIYEKLISELKVAVVDKYTFQRLVDRAHFFGLNSEAEEFKKVLEEKIVKLSKSNRPSDWLSLYRIDHYNNDAVYKIVEYLLMRYETGTPSKLLWYIDVFMNKYGGNNPHFSELDELYAKRVGNRGYKDHYWELRKVPETELIIALSFLDHGLIKACKEACEKKSPYAYLWCELAVAFSPNFKPPKCPPKPKTEKAKPQKTVSTSNKTHAPQFNSDFDFATTDTTYTSSDSYSFRYTEEERRRAQEIISDYNAQKDAETYTAHLLGDIDTPSNLDYLVETFSGIDWSEFGEGDV